MQEAVAAANTLHQLIAAKADLVAAATAAAEPELPTQVVVVVVDQLAHFQAVLAVAVL
jgi:hypothetical protein